MVNYIYPIICKNIDSIDYTHWLDHEEVNYGYDHTLVKLRLISI